MPTSLPAIELRRAPGRSGHIVVRRRGPARGEQQQATPTARMPQPARGGRSHDGAPRDPLGPHPPLAGPRAVLHPDVSSLALPKRRYIAGTTSRLTSVAVTTPPRSRPLRPAPAPPALAAPPITAAARTAPPCASPASTVGITRPVPAPPPRRRGPIAPAPQAAVVTEKAHHPAARAQPDDQAGKEPRVIRPSIATATSSPAGHRGDRATTPIAASRQLRNAAWSREQGGQQRGDRDRPP